MTKQELNQDCRRLINHYKKGVCQDGTTINDFIDEFKRIYGADKNFEYLTSKNALDLFRINLSMVIVPLHQFGIQYEL